MRHRAVSRLLTRQASFLGVKRRCGLQKIASFWAVASHGPMASALDWRKSPPVMPPRRCTHSPFDGGANRVLDVLQEFLSRLEELGVERPEARKADRLSHSSFHDLASELASGYLKLDRIVSTATIDEQHQSDRVSILRVLATQCNPLQESINEAIQKYQKQTRDVRSHLNMSQLTAKLRHACAPKYEQLFQHVMEENPAKGLVFLVSLREDLLSVRQSGIFAADDEVEQMKQLDNYLRALLSTWFSPGMLEIRRITYEGTSASVIETIATKEAVHPLKSLEDLRSRLGNDRRVFAAFHPLLPNVPLVFCHVALRSFVPSTMSDVLEADTENIDFRVAAFYSISSTQSGLSGIDLGQFLIKQAVRLLRSEFVTLETFVTLSPIPRFRLWLKDKLLLNQDGGTFVDLSFLGKEDVATLASILGCSQSEAPTKLLGMLDDPSELMDEYSAQLAPVLMKLAARYLVTEKHRGKPLDGVARFHIRNGAQMYRLNYQADPSRKGLHNSLGIMINYLYNLETMQGNKLLYESSLHVPVCEDVSRWLA